jgi:hypothetical protein
MASDALKLVVRAIRKQARVAFCCVFNRSKCVGHHARLFAGE